VNEEVVNVKEIGRKAGEILKKIGSGLEYTAERLEKHDIPRLTKNVLILSTGAMMMYTMGIAVSAMLPTARQVFEQFGSVLGYMIPIMINIMMMSLMVALIKILLR